MKLPTADEINPNDDLDGRHAEACFLGKTLDEADAMFRENALYYQEDLMFMGVVGFRFYVRALLNYLRCESAVGDSDIINCFAGLLEFRITSDEPAELTPIAAEIADACGYVMANYERFAVIPEIFGDLRPRLAKTKSQFSQLVEIPGR